MSVKLSSSRVEWAGGSPASCGGRGRRLLFGYEGFCYPGVIIGRDGALAFPLDDGDIVALATAAPGMPSGLLELNHTPAAEGLARTGLRRHRRLLYVLTNPVTQLRHGTSMAHTNAKRRPPTLTNVEGRLRRQRAFRATGAGQQTLGIRCRSRARTHPAQVATVGQRRQRSVTCGFAASDR